MRSRVSVETTRTTAGTTGARVLLTVVLSVFVAVAALHARSVVPGSSTQFRAEILQRVAYTIVLDAADAPVSHLQETDFRIFEGDDERPINMFLAPTSTGLDLAVLLDRSSTMSGRTREVQDWTARILDGLRSTDCVNVLWFNERVHGSGWQQPHETELRQFLSEVEFDGDTALYDAILQAQRAFVVRAHFSAAGSSPHRPLGYGYSNRATEPVFPFRPLLSGGAALPGRSSGACRASLLHPGDRRQAILMLTDGEDTASQSNFIEVLLATAFSRVPIFAASLTPRMSSNARFDLLRRFRRKHQDNRWRLRASAGNFRRADVIEPIVRASGGSVLDAMSTQQAYEGLGDLLLRAFYMIGFPSGEPGVVRNNLPVRVETIVDGLRVEAQTAYPIAGISHAATATMAVVRGLEHLGSGDLGAAQREFDVAIGQDAELGAAHYGRGLVLTRLGDATQARAALLQAAQLAPWLSDVHAQLAMVENQAGNHELASAYARQAVDADPGAVWTIGNLLSDDSENRDRRLVYLLHPRAQTVDAQLVIVRILASIGRAILNDDNLGLAAHSEHADLGLVLSIDELTNGLPRRLVATVEVYGHSGNRVTKRSLNVDDVDRKDRIDTAAARLLGALNTNE